MNEKKAGILDILEESKGYETALLTTFNLEIDFFEKAVLSRLIRNDIRKVSIFVDAKELSKALISANPGSIGQRYVVNPVSMNASFHPKLILLLGEKKARLIVSSANLKLSGYCVNNEVFDYIDYDEKHQECRNIIVDTIRFFDRCNQYTPQLDNVLLKSVRGLSYNRKASSNDYMWLLENTEESVLKQVAGIIIEKVQSVKIAVPYYDNSLSALKAVREVFPNASICLYLQHGKSTFPEKTHADYYDVIRVFDTVLAPGNENRHFYHGKVFLFKTANIAYILFGSSNCTMSALTKAKTENGNVEANLLIRGMVEDFDYYFDQFSIAEGKNPDSQIMSYESEEKGNYYFKYGVAEKMLVLHIGYIKEKNPVFSLQNEVLQWRKSGDEIIIEAEAENVDSIFDITVSYDNCKETIRCWYINRELIELNRLSVSEGNKLKDTEDFGIGEKFLPDYEKLLKEMDSCKADFLNTKQMIAPILNFSGLQEDDSENDPESEDDFVINVELSDEDYAAYSKYKLIERIRGRVIKRYFESSPLYLRSFTHQLSERYEKTEDYNETEPKRRRATSEEKRFERFVKRCVRGMLDEEFAQMTDITHYFGLIAVVFSILEKYNRNEKVEGIFPDEYVITTRCALLTLFLNKPVTDWEYRNNVIEKTLDIVWDNYKIIRGFYNTDQQGTYNQKNRQLLLLLDKRFSIRENFTNYFNINLERALTIKEQDEIKQAISYIDQLFGYKALNQIQNMVRKNLGKSSALVPMKKSNGIYILVNTNTPGKYYKPDTSIIRELNRYSLRVERIKTVIFDFKKPQYKPSDSNILVRHTIDLERRQWSYYIEDGNHRVRKFPSSYLTW